MRSELKPRVEDGLDVVYESLGGRDWRVRVLREGPMGQGVFEFTRGDRRVVGKAYATDAGQRSFKALKLLSSRSFNHLNVPALIRYDVDRRFLLTEVAPGESVEGLALAGKTDCLRRIGLALRELHSSRLDFGPPKQLADHIEDLVRPSSCEFSALYPIDADLVEEFLRLALTLDESLAATSASSPIHRDFHLGQLFDDGERITVVDWDDCAMGDPAFDVGYFATYLRTHRPMRDAKVETETFLQGYGASADVLGRLRTYACFNYVRRCCRRIRLRDLGWESEVEWMLTLLESELRDHDRRGA